MADTKYSSGGEGFRNAFPVTEDDNTVYRPALQALYVGTAGDLVLDIGGDICPYKNYQGWYFGSVRRIMSASTAADIIGHR